MTNYLHESSHRYRANEKGNNWLEKKKKKNLNGKDTHVQNL